MIQFKCKCGELLEMEDKYAGRKVKCPECKTLMKVPAPKPKAVRKRPPAEPEARPVGAQPAPQRFFPLIFLGTAILCLAGAVLAGVYILSKRDGEDKDDRP